VDMLAFLKTMLFLLDPKLAALGLGDLAGVALLPAEADGPHSGVGGKGTLLISYGLPITERSCNPNEIFIK